MPASKKAPRWGAQSGHAMLPFQVGMFMVVRASTADCSDQ
jgi:hypothetical protein